MAERKNELSQDERTLAGIAHGSVILGLFTNGIGGIAAALVIWITQKEKSAYVAGQSLQALLYQALAFLVTGVAFFCWGVLWLLLLIPPLIADPGAFNAEPPPTIWIGLALMIAPVTVWSLTFLYSLWGSYRCFKGEPFRYALVGRWLEDRL